MIKYHSQQELTNAVIQYFLNFYEKIALKQFASGDLYIKIYSDEPHEVTLKKLEDEFENELITFSSYSQDPPFIEDGVGAIEIMTEIQLG